MSYSRSNNAAERYTGAISDSSLSKYRRRYWIGASTALLVVSTLVLAFCQNIAAFFVDLFGGSAGDWDPKRAKQVRSPTSDFLVRHSCAPPGREYRYRHSRVLFLRARLCAQCIASISAELAP